MKRRISGRFTAKRQPAAALDRPGAVPPAPEDDAGSTRVAVTHCQWDAHAAEREVAADWNVGDVVLDLYLVKRIHESGGMGRVYQVHHRGWNTELAVKSPRADFFRTQAQKEDFARECEAWIDLGLHPHIASCYYVRTLGGIPRVFAEYVKGGTLEEWIASGKLYEDGERETLTRIMDVAIQMAWGLDYAHQRGLVHQDVKPANTLLTPKGTAKITDFGLARARAAAGEPSREATPDATIMVPNVGLMAPAYASPEQAGGQPLTRRTDIWSWALSVLEMLVGQRTWARGQLAHEILEAFLQRENRRGAVPEIPADLLEMLRQCFRWEPGERPNTMGEIASQLIGMYREITETAYTREAPQMADMKADSLNNKALSLLDLGRWEEAEKCFDEGLKADPHHPESVYNRGLRLWRSARITDDELVRQLEAVGTTHGESWRDKFLLACVHLERGDAESAVALLKKCQQAAPGDAQVETSLRQAKELLSESSRCLRSLEGHGSPVNSVSFSPDGRTALSGSGWLLGKRDNVLKLWDLTSGQCLRTFDGHTGTVNTVCFSPDGRTALSGSDDKSLKLWDLTSGRCLRGFAGHAADVNSVCFSPDGRTALSGSNDKTLKLWDLASGRCLHSFTGHTDVVASVCISPDGRQALSVGAGFENPKQWNLVTGQCLRSFEGHTSWVSSACIAADGRQALSGSGDKTLKLWDLAAGRCLRSFEGHIDQVISVCISPDGRLALSGGEDRTLRLWDLASGRCLRSFTGHTGVVTSVCISADGRQALSGSQDESVKLWQLGRSLIQGPAFCQPRSSKRVVAESVQVSELKARAQASLGRNAAKEAYRIIARARKIPGYALSPELLELQGQACLRGRAARLISAWSVRSFHGHDQAVLSVCLSPNGRQALSGSGDGTLRLWDLATGKCLRRFAGHRDSVNAVCISPDGRQALSGGGGPLAGGDWTLRLWDLATGRCLRSFAGHSNQVNSVCISPDGRLALSGSLDKTVKLWDLATGRCLWSVEGDRDVVSNVCITPDGRQALSQGRESTLKSWDLATGRRLRNFETNDWVTAVCISPDGRQALSGGSSAETLKLWDLATGRCLRRYEGRITSSVLSLCVSSDGRQALSGGSDKTVKFWDLVTGHCLRSFEGHAEAVTSVCISPDGRQALSGSNDKTLRLWQLDWEYEFPPAAGWDDGARPHLVNFLTLRTPQAGRLPEDRQPTAEEVRAALTRRGSPVWSEDEFRKLLSTLARTGYGWLRTEGVRMELEKMAADWQGPPE